MEAAVNGAILDAGVAIWLVAGYLIQRFGFRPMLLSLRHLQAHRRCCFLSQLYWYSISDNGPIDTH